MRQKAPLVRLGLETAMGRFSAQEELGWLSSSARMAEMISSGEEAVINFFLKSSFLKIKNKGKVINIIGLIIFLIATVFLRKRLTRYKDDADTKNIITLE